MAGPVRVLFTSTPGSGHVHPLVPLALALRERGEEVLWAASEGTLPTLARAGLPAEKAGIDFGAGPPPFDPAELVALPPRERSTFIFSSVFAGVLVPAMLADLVPIVERFRPHVLVHEVAEFAGAIAAAAAGVPSVTHALGRVMPAAQMTAASEQLAGMWEELGLEPAPYAGTYEHLYLDICPPGLQSAEVEHVGRVQPLRPVAFGGTGDEPTPRWNSELAALPLVYVTFGTTFAAAAAPVATVLEGLRELPVRVLVTLGTGAEPDRYGEQPENVHLARYIPQTEILPECSLVVSHAGSGTLLASLARGIRQLCIPLAADQFHNAEACVAAGAGVSLSAEGLTPEALRTAAAGLLEDDRAGDAAARIAQEIARMPAPAQVADELARRFR